MSIRTKTLLMIALTWFVLIAVLYVTAQVILLPSFTVLERDRMGQNLTRVRNALETAARSLNTRSADWAFWDETYAYARGEAPGFLEEEVPVIDVAVNIGINLMLFADAEGNLLGGRAADLVTGEEVPLPEDQINALLANPLARPAPATTEIQGGVLVNDDLPMLVSFAPILTSDVQGPAVGSVIYAYYLDDTQIAALANTVELPLTLYLATADDLPTDVQQAQAVLASDAPSTSVPLSDTRLAGYTLVNDVNGNPALIARIEIPRAIYAQGTNTVGTFLLALAIAGLVIIGLLGFLLERVVLRRIDYLSGSVSRIQRGASERVFVSGKDELSRLGDGINAMLTRIESYQDSIKASEDRLRTVVNNAPIMMWAVDKNEHLTFVQGGQSQRKDVKLNSFIGQAASQWSDLLALDVIGMRRALTGVETTTVTQIGEQIFTTAYKTLRDDDTNDIMGVIGVATDITEARRAEDKLAQKSQLLARTHELIRSTLDHLDGAMKRNANVIELQEYLDFAQTEFKKLG